MGKQFKIADAFWSRYQALVCDRVIPYQQRALNDAVPGVEKSYAIQNFRIAAGKETGEFGGWIFQDSDVAKWIEAAAYSLLIKPDAALEAQVDATVALIGEAQGEDGYINTYFTIAHPERRWENLQEAHELYCAGHMIEAAVAYYECTGKTALLSIMERNAAYIESVFGRGKRRGFPGHPEIELALVRLYQATDKKQYLKLAQYFVDERGTDPNFYLEESEKRDWTVWHSDPCNRGYTQNSKPVRDQSVAEGHAVRAVYLYAGMADIARETGDIALGAACERLWQNITNKQMYITGGIGSVKNGEAFSVDYDLPNDTAYSESCASIGLMFFAKRMLLLEKNGKYGDVMERALYNCVLGGMSLDGTQFFYVNPLEVNPEYSGKIVNHEHVLPQRPGWYGCACCPPNIARTIASLSEYCWFDEDTALYANLFVGGSLDLSETRGLKIQAKTAYPYGNTVTYQFDTLGKTVHHTLALRIPAWSETYQIQVNGLPFSPRVEKGFAYVEKDFATGDSVELSLDMTPRKVYSHVLVRENEGACCLQRGPLVYCFEGHDNGAELRNLRIEREGEITELPSEELGGILRLQVPGVRLDGGDALYTFSRPRAVPITLSAIPYHVWCNRGLTQMTVWMKEG